jgi:hypothetical protein
MRLSDRPPARRSTLFAWYVREWEVLRGAPINWSWMMGEISKRGLLDRNGDPPRLQTAKQTWYRCKETMERRQASGARAPLPHRTIVPTETTRRQFTHAKIKE